MTGTADHWPPGLPKPDPIRHAWNCTRPPPEDRYRVDKTGLPVVVKRCPKCGATEKPRPT
jgi:hypothetical protein